MPYAGDHSILIVIKIDRLLRRQNWLNGSALVLGVTGVFFICTFKIIDPDFWWHVKAGEVIWQMRALPATDPFAWSRAGLPYLAVHEWLAQVLMAGVYGLGGAVGIILLRCVLVSLTFVLIVTIDRKSLWMNVWLAVLAANAVRPMLLDRPQLFTFALFAAFLLLATQVLDATTLQRRRRVLLVLIPLEILWVNLHGAASLLGLMIVGALMVERMETMMREHGVSSLFQQSETRDLVLICIGLGIALLLSPSGIGNLTYLHQLLTDKTATLIYEWQPRAWPVYLHTVGPFVALAVAMILKTRYKPVFWLTLLSITVILSRQAARHEILAVLTALAAIIHQLREDRQWQHLLTRLLQHWMLGIGLMIVLMTGAVVYSAQSLALFNRNNQSAGFGVVTPAAGAWRFLSENSVVGRMFNTYALGGELLFYGYPSHGVFIDGRNVDYGYAFMQQMLDAGKNATAWQALDDRYHFTSAVIRYDDAPDGAALPYISALQADAHWALVYVDDRVAVYLKQDVPQNAAVIGRFRYAAVTPTLLRDPSALSGASPALLQATALELQRMIAAHPMSVTPRLALAQIFTLVGQYDKAAVLLAAADTLQPDRYDTWYQFGELYGAQERWSEAGLAFEHMLRVMGDRGRNIDYAGLATVFERAGEPEKAALYRSRATPGGGVR